MLLEVLIDLFNGLERYPEKEEVTAEIYLYSKTIVLSTI